MSTPTASEKQILISPWMPDTNPLNLAVLGKAVEEGGEVTTACGRCIIQGIEESEPVSLKPNRKMLSDEIADSFATCGWLIDYFGLDRAYIEARAAAKRKGFERWLDLIRGMLPPNFMRKRRA